MEGSAWAWVALGLSEAVSLVCAAFLWRRSDHWARKAVWTLVLVLPLLGPVFYGAFYDPPSIQPEHERSPDNRDVDTGAGGGGSARRTKAERATL